MPLAILWNSRWLRVAWHYDTCTMQIKLPITKTCLYKIDPLKPHFYIVKLGFTGVYIIFLNFTQNVDCGYPLEPPHRGGSNEYPQSMFWAEIWTISEFFLSENFPFLEVKFSIYLNTLVVVMHNLCILLLLSYIACHTYLNCIAFLSFVISMLNW